MRVDEFENKLNDDLLFSYKLSKRLETINLKAPYHINIIDELHINENAHSRILYKLLNYKNESGSYEILQSFISFVKKKYHKDEEKIKYLNNITIVHPEITQEDQRIDLWAIEKQKYALIFENKVYGAIDREAQLYRYIEKTRKRGFKDDMIFIFYLPQTKDGEPSEQTWANEKDKFVNRYFKIPFKEDILPWLENSIIQNTRHKDFILLTALSQYVDYLKGLFDIRNNKNEIKMAEQEIINNILGLKDQSNEEKINILNMRIEELQDTINHLSNYRYEISEEIRKKQIDKLKEDIEKEFYDFNYCNNNYGGVSFSLMGKNYQLYIGNDGRWYCQLELDSEDGDIEDETLNQSGIRDELYLPRNYKGKYIWQYINGGELKDAYKCMQNVINKVRKYKEINNK